MSPADYIKTLHLFDKEKKTPAFFIFVSIFLGIISGFAAVILKNSVHYTRHFLFSHSPDSLRGNYLFIVLPIIGLFFTFLFMKFIIKQWIGHGIPNVLYAISRKRGRIKPIKILFAFIGSIFTVGFGGSVGLEGPIVSSGAGIGANIAQIFHLRYKTTILLISAATAGAISAIFKAPVTGIVFVIEVLMIDLRFSTLLPILISSVTGTIISYWLLGKDVIWPIRLHYLFSFSHLWLFISLGILTGLFSTYYFYIYTFIHHSFEKIKHWEIRFLFGSTLLGLLIYIFPSLYGEGYDSVNLALHGSFDFAFINTFYAGFGSHFFWILSILLLLILFKVFATSLTFAAGGVGGDFAPTLFIGSGVGLFFFLIISHFWFPNANPALFVLLGMSGMVAGILNGPLTGIFLIAEITGSYHLFIPLMLVAAFSYLTKQLFQKESIYTYKLKKRRELITHDIDFAALRLMDIKDLLETNFITVTPDESLEEIIKKIQETHRNIFPVVDTNNILTGLLLFDDIRKIMFHPDIYKDLKALDIMTNIERKNLIDLQSDDIKAIASKFLRNSKFTMPVINNKHYVGFISRANFFTKYHEQIKEFVSI